MCLTVGRQSRDHRPLSRDPSVSFNKKFPNCLKRPKTLFDGSADGRVTSDHCRVTVQRHFSRKFLIAWNVQKTLFDSRPTVAWPQPLSRDRSATFLKIFPNRLKRPENVAWQSADGRVTSDHCCVTVQRLFSKLFFYCLKRPKNVIWQSARRSRDLRPLSRDRSATFFINFANCLKRPKNVVWQSADGRVTSTTVAWQFSDFFQNFPKSLETFKKRGLTVGRRSRDLRPLSRDRSATFFKIFFYCLTRPKKTLFGVGRRSRDLNHCRVTVQRLFS